MKKEPNSIMGLILMVMYFMLGIFLITNPEPSIKIMCGVIGGVLGVVGVVRIINYFRLEQYEAMIRKELAVGMFMLLIAFYVIMKAEVIAGIIPIALGVVLVFQGMTLAQMALDLQRVKRPGWYVELISAGVILVLGLLVLFIKFDAAKTRAIFLGISYVVLGIGMLVSMFLMRTYKKEYKKLEVVESTAIEKQ